MSKTYIETLEMFAGMAMQGLLAEQGSKLGYQDIAVDAVGHAKALMEELEIDRELDGAKREMEG